MRDSKIHELVRSYRAGRMPRERIVERVAGLLYGAPRRFGFDDEDAAAEALERHGRRIAALADRFEDRGLDFDVYLRSNLRYLARTMRRERRRCREREYVCEAAVLEVDAEDRTDRASRPLRRIPRARRAAGEIARDDLARNASYLITGKRRMLAAPEVAALSSRIVFLALKCAWDIDDEMADRVAAASGVDPAWLGAALVQARRSLESERCRYERMLAWRNGSWCRLRMLESRLRSEIDDDQRQRIKAGIERERVRLERARSEIAAFKPVVPNSVVSRILGVPKGTVDSGLYYLKRRSASASGRQPAAGETAALGAAAPGTAAPMERAADGLAPRAPERVSSRHGNLCRHR
jgi:hypothetical protein